MAYKSNANSWFKQEEAILKRTQRNMAGVTVNRAQMLAPKDTGALISSGRVVEGNGKATAVFGGADVGVPYARRRHYENKKNPQTLHYLKRAGDSVVKEGVKKYYDMSK